MVVVVVVVVYSEFSVLLWSKALVLDLDQAEQYLSLPNLVDAGTGIGIKKSICLGRHVNEFYVHLLITSKNKTFS